MFLVYCVSRLMLDRIVDLLLLLTFFFFKQKTAYEMRISDWSSDVCSSDLPCAGGRRRSKLSAPHPIDQGDPIAPADPAAADLFWSLQYCRASTLSLIRLELAMESGDRQRIIEAMDRLHALDREIERKVSDLSAPAGPDRSQIGRASCRERVCQYVSIPVGAVALKKKK